MTGKKSQSGADPGCTEHGLRGLCIVCERGGTCRRPQQDFCQQGGGKNAESCMRIVGWRRGQPFSTTETDVRDWPASLISLLTGVPLW